MQENHRSHAYRFTVKVIIHGITIQYKLILYTLLYNFLHVLIHSAEMDIMP